MVQWYSVSHHYVGMKELSAQSRVHQAFGYEQWYHDNYVIIMVSVLILSCKHLEAPNAMML